MVPTKENVDKIAKYFNVSRKDLINDSDLVDICLNNNKSVELMEKIFLMIVIVTNALMLILPFIPFVKQSVWFYKDSRTNRTYKYTSIVRLFFDRNNRIIILFLFVFAVCL
ncbi:MAG: hypothetical protein K6G28_01385 [Acholeplasmatales bacterium]|nr:hypothetical protein [Acholeplasmatales bacterium]